MTMWGDFSDQYFQWWQDAVGRYIDIMKKQPLFIHGLGLFLDRYLESQKQANRVLDETWRLMRIPPLEEVIRLHEKLNQLESSMIELQAEKAERPESQQILQELTSLRDSVSALAEQIRNSLEEHGEKTS